MEIQKDIDQSYELTGRGNCVAVITDGTAVLGLGDIGPDELCNKCLLSVSFGQGAEDSGEDTFLMFTKLIVMEAS